jgi:hypothetical protein
MTYQVVGPRTPDLFGQFGANGQRDRRNNEQRQPDRGRGSLAKNGEPLYNFVNWSIHRLSLFQRQQGTEWRSIYANQLFTATGGTANLIVNIQGQQFGILANSYSPVLVTIANTTSPRLAFQEIQIDYALSSYTPSNGCLFCIADRLKLSGPLSRMESRDNRTHG